MQLLLTLLVPLLALSVGLPARASNMMDQLVRSYCMKAVNDEVRSSGKPVPSGMAGFTCDCVVEEMGKGRSVSQASSTCKSLAIQKYGL